MTRALLVIAVIIQIVVAIQSEGLARALAELCAFLLVVAIVFELKPAKRTKLQRNIEDA